MSSDIPRLSPIENEIMALLIARGEMYGLELVSASNAIKRGSVYVTLGRMAEKGWVTSRTVKATNVAGLPRRLFQPTGEGMRVFRAWAAANVVLSQVFA